MDSLSTVIKFFQDCGLFLYPSALIMALGITIAVERYIFLTKARTQNRKAWAHILPLLQKGHCAKSRAPRRRPRGGRQDRQLRPDADAGRPERGLRRAMEEGMMRSCAPRERTHYIAPSPNVITLVGLLGTIMA